MASKDGKFGTFGGVFTPSLLTILGVIMYLRLPWVVGSAGLWGTLGIIGVAHVVSLFTGMSISSIATDKKVGAGGPYYIVSRSLGLPIGGTLGLALFLGLSFSISLYVIGFCESLLATLPGVELSVDNIRIYGTGVVIGLTILTLVSTAIAIKMQYVIMALIAASLVSIGLGSPDVAPVAPLLARPEGGGELNTLFAIFFPAVTGFTAGVNMSGDLRDSRRAIPVGTMASILTGGVVYVSLAAFLAYRVGPEQLVADGEVLYHIAAWPPAVLGGIWGATLSSAIGSILGAPRILQALGSDRIMPKFFGRGYGKTGEPRNALIPAFLIAEAGILVAELDVIARVVSMVFLTTYGFLNLSCWIESLTSPDFRPSWKIPKLVPLTGAVVCIVLMIQLDLVSMIAAIVGMLAVFVVLERRRLELESGDAWEGIWASLVRSGLSYLSRSAGAQRNWRPNILLFRLAENPALQRFASALVSGSGMVTDFELAAKGSAGPVASDEARVGVFRHRLVVDDPHEAVVSVCRYHGFAGISPNTVLLDLDEQRANLDALGRLATEACKRDFNLLMLDSAQAESSARERIDVWWRPGAGNFPFSVSLIRFVLSTDLWSKAKVRFLVFSEDSSNNDTLRTRARELLRELRVDATMRVVNARSSRQTFDDMVTDESADADLVILGLSTDADGNNAEFIGRAAALSDRLPSVLLIKGSSAFKEVLPIARGTASFVSLVSANEDELELPALRLPDNIELARAAVAFGHTFDTLATHLYEDCIARLHGQNIELLEELCSRVEKEFVQLEKQLAEVKSRRQRHAINRVQSAFLQQARSLLRELDDDTVENNRAVIDGAITRFVESSARGPGPEQQLLVTRPKSELRTAKGDSAWLRSFKRRRRFSAWLRREDPRYQVPVGTLQSHYFEKACDEMLCPAVYVAASHQHRFAAGLGRVLKSCSASWTMLGHVVNSADGFDELVREQRDAVLGRLGQLLDSERQASSEAQARVFGQSRALAQAFADDIGRIDVIRLARKERGGAALDKLKAEELRAFTPVWAANQRCLLDRGLLGLRLSMLQHRLAAIADKAKAAFSLQIRNGTLSECEALCEKIEAMVAAVSGPGPHDRALLPRSKLATSFAGRFDPTDVVDTFVRETEPSIDELGETISTPSDESIRLLQEGSREPAVMIDFPLRRHVQFLLESELIAGLKEVAAAVLPREEHAAGIAKDVSRLLAFQLGELDAADEADAADAMAQLNSVLENSVARLQPELDGLRKLTPDLCDFVDRKLEVVFDGTDSFELTGMSSDLGQHLARQQGQRAVSLVRAGWGRAGEGIVGLIYRRSAGVLLARKLRAKTYGTLVDRLQQFVRKATPRADVTAELPFFYRQLFFGQSSFDESFWVGRDDELSRARAAIAGYRRGARGAVFVVGDPGAGKSALCQRIVHKLLGGNRVVRIDPPRGGSSLPQAFVEACAKAVARDATSGSDPGLAVGVDAMIHGLPEASVIVLDDVELWWERSEAGLANIDEIIRLIAEHGQRCLFVLSMGAAAFRFVERFRRLSDHALAVIECGPVPARTLEAIVRLRHGSTGVQYEYAGRREDTLAKWRLARLFSAHFDYATGNVGAALRAWITHIDRVHDERVAIRVPEPKVWDVLDDLRPEWAALLVQFLLHRQLTFARLLRVTGLRTHDLAGQVEALVRIGLLTRGRQGVLEINRFVQHIVVDRFAKRGIA